MNQIGGKEEKSVATIGSKKEGDKKMVVAIENADDNKKTHTAEKNV
jgi:hypothetical protein